MRKITQFIVDTYVDDLDGEDYEAGFIRDAISKDGAVGELEPHVVEIIDDENVVVKGKQGMYVVTDIGTDDEFIMRLIERVERREYTEDGEDVKEIIEL